MVGLGVDLGDIAEYVAHNDLGTAMLVRALAAASFAGPLVLTRMASDLNMPLEVVTCPTVREPDGLALSSRNRYLDPHDRQRALSVYRALQAAATGVAAGETDVGTLKRVCRTELEDNVDRIDYVEILAADDLSELETIDRPALCAIAAYVGNTRLIDNVLLSP
jgi:pantoate--beta-alanine ligase